MADRNEPLYPYARPIDCDVLILCEGDAVGYESMLLKSWADGTDLRGRFVKVLACGTSDALYGMADAAGRTVPVIVVEDRDFRTPDEARTECRKKLNNREGRNVAMRGWFAWERAEIENYFMDDAVLPPVFSVAFDCSPDDVRDAVRDALEAFCVSQALEYALYRARRSWLSTDANRALRVGSVRWSATGATALTAAEVRENLERKLKEWQQSLHDGATWEDPMSGEQLLADFDAKCRDWANLAYGQASWQHDWACKEVLKRVRMTLAQRKGGWWSPPGSSGAVDWASLKDDKARDQHDRVIEREAQPALVKALLARLAAVPPPGLRRELDHLGALVREA